ncbi:MAG TPA: hypothetical protein VM580_35130 [Labilithrix sp.]|nr:hypothetical protein [Labilithrix sp.]
MDAPAALPPAPDQAPYVYAATDNRPRQTREIELCEKASHFDWQYTGAFAAGFGAALYLNLDYFKHRSEPGIRLLGPAFLGFTWGGFLSGGYLSLPKCDPLWAYGPPPEGNVRSAWPLATLIAVVSGVSSPILDYVFLGPVKRDWSVEERAGRVFAAAGASVLGAIFPYFVSPRTWSGAREIERMRVEGMPGGARLSYTLAF